MQSWASVCWATVEGRGERTDSSVSWASKMKQYFRNSSRSLRGTSGYVFECPSGVINECVGTVHRYSSRLSRCFVTVFITSCEGLLGQ